MQSIQNFAFEQHLVRVVDREGEPWFVGVDVCRALELSKPENALATLDDDERYTLSEGVMGDGAGRSARVVVSEPGVFRLVFRSRKEEAEKFKRWLAHEVLPAIRKTGQYAPDAMRQPGREQMQIDIERDAPLNARVDAVRLASRLWGREQARALWSKLGLPEVPPPPPSEGRGEGLNCLQYLLESCVDARTIRDLVEEALADNLEATALLRIEGIIVETAPDMEGFHLSSTAHQVRRLYADTPWHSGRFVRVLRRLPGVIPSGVFRFAGHPSRSTFIPARLLDDDSSVLLH